MNRSSMSSAHRRVVRSLTLALLPLATALFSACDSPGSGDVAAIEATGGVGAQLIFDANGNGAVDQGDQPLVGWTVNLEQPAGGTVASQVTGENGVAIFEEVPIGQMAASVPADELGDTLYLIPASVPVFTLGAFQSVQLQPVLALPFYPIPEVRTLPSAKPLFTSGVALNRFAEGDRSLHLKSGNNYLRVLDVDESTSFNVGDSVRVAGRTAVDQGVSVLDGRGVYRLAATGRTVTPVSLSTGEAAGARGGALDAALVQVSLATILDVTEDSDGSVVLRIDDGTGSLRLRFRPFFGINPEFFDAGTDYFQFAAGLLVPVRVDDQVVWEIRPRTADDVLIVRPSN